jgi:hypothetical protein
LFISLIFNYLYLFYIVTLPGKMTRSRRLISWSIPTTKRSVSPRRTRSLTRWSSEAPLQRRLRPKEHGWSSEAVAAVEAGADSEATITAAAAVVVESSQKSGMTAT